MEAQGQAQDRRRFLWLGGCVAVGVALTQAAWATLRFARAPVSYGPPLVRVLGPLSAFAQGVLTFVDAARVFVRRDDDGVRAMSAVCTHLGCTVRRHDSGFVCPCHGSRFDESGAVIGGPAPNPLTFYHVAKDKRDRLVVDLRRPVDPTARLQVT